MTDTNERTFEIYAANWTRAHERIEELARRATRLGMDAPKAEITREWQIEEKDEFGWTHTRTMYEVRVTGQAPRIDGFELFGVIEWDAETGQTYVKGVPGMGEMPREFRQADATRCDHCGQPRNRKNGYLIREMATGAISQIGSTCLRDFLGHVSPDQIVWNASFWVELEESMADDDFRMYRPSGLDRDYWMACTAFAIRLDGWVSKTQAQESGMAPTTTFVHNFYQDNGLKDRDGRIIDRPSELDHKRAQDALAWAAGLDPDDCNDYLYTLHQIATAKDGALNPNLVGFASSMIPAHDRAMESELERQRKAEADQASEWVGAINKRQVFTATLTKVVELPDYGYGPQYLHIFRDADGNILTWKTGAKNLRFVHFEKEWDWDIDNLGATFTGKATVKDHNEYNGIKQTVLTRCAFEIVD